MNHICRLITTGSLLATMFVLFLTWNAAQATNDPYDNTTTTVPETTVPDTTLPPETTVPETTVPETTPTTVPIPDVCHITGTDSFIPEGFWQLTDQPDIGTSAISGQWCGPIPPEPEACLQHITNGPDLAEGDYVIDPINPTGTTRWGILPCGPVQVDIGTPPTTATSSTGGTLPETGTGTGIIAAIASLLLLSGIGTVYATRRS